MPFTLPRVRSIAPAIVALALLITACGGPAASTAPSAAGPTAGASVALTEAPSASALVTVAPVTAPPVTAPPVTAPPVTAVPVTEPPITPPPATAAPPAVGVAIKVGDEQLMTVLDAEQWPGTTSVKPAKGKTFFTVSIRIDATATTSWDSADFKLKDTAGKLYVWRPGRSPHLYDGANMTVGQNYIGWITYEIPKTSLVGLTLQYKPHFLTGVTFKIPVS